MYPDIKTKGDVTMIRVYSANFTPEDYKNISDIFWAGLKDFCANHKPQNLAIEPCDCEHDCPYYKACKAVAKAEIFCLRKANENGES